MKAADFFTLDPRKIDVWRTTALVVFVCLVFVFLRLKLMPEIREVPSTVFKRVPEIRKVAKVQRVLVPCPEGGIVALNRDQVTAQLGPDWTGPATAQRGPDWTGPATAQLGPEWTATGTVQPITLDPADDAGSTSPPFQGEGQGGDGSEVSPDPRPLTPDPWPLATADLPETDRGNQVVAVYNSTTGVTDLVAKEKPAPWVQIRNDYVLGLRYGIDHRLNQTGTLYGSWTVLRFKDLYLSGYSELATDPQRIGDDLRWKGQVDLQYRH